jgi:hypothetical protein
MGERHHSRQQASKRNRSHKEARMAFPEYAVAMALGQAPRTQFPEVAAHLDHCAACRAELETLLELVAPIYSGQVEPTADLPGLDISFLRVGARPPLEPARPWFIDEARRLVVSFSEALLAALRPAAVVRAARGDALYRYQPALPSQLSLTIDVFASSDGADMVNIQVLIDVPDRDPLEQAGIPVTLRMGDIVRQEATGETGSATFAAVPMGLLPSIRIEIALAPDQ